MGIEWLRSALVCNGVTVRDPLDPGSVTDADLLEICLRMHAIMGTIEQSRCEGRLLPLDLFDGIDTLESRVFHGPIPQLAGWVELIIDFGSYYGLDGTSPLVVDPAVWQMTEKRFRRPAWPGATGDLAE